MLAPWDPAGMPGIGLAVLPPLPCPDGRCGLLVCGDCTHMGFTRQHLRHDGVCPNGHRSQIKTDETKENR